MRGVHFFVAKHAAGRNHTKWQAECTHAAHLHRRCMRAKQVAVRKPESILHIARRMRSRNIQRIEIMLFRFHFRTIKNGESERSKKVFNLFLQLRNGMKAAWPNAARGQCDVDPFLA